MPYQLYWSVEKLIFCVYQFTHKPKMQTHDLHCSYQYVFVLTFSSSVMRDQPKFQPKLWRSPTFSTVSCLFGDSVFSRKINSIHHKSVVCWLSQLQLAVMYQQSGQYLYILWILDTGWSSPVKTCSSSNTVEFILCNIVTGLSICTYHFWACATFSTGQNVFFNTLITVELSVRVTLCLPPLLNL